MRELIEQLKHVQVVNKKLEEELKEKINLRKKNNNKILRLEDGNREVKQRMSNEEMS